MSLQEQMLNEYVDMLVSEIGIPEDTDQAVKEEMRKDILERLNNFMINRALKSLPDEKIEALNKVVEGGGTGLDAWDFIEKNVDNFGDFSTKTMREFRDIYLGAK